MCHHKNVIKLRENTLEITLMFFSLCVSVSQHSYSKTQELLCVCQFCVPLYICDPDVYHAQVSAGILIIYNSN